MFYTRDLQKILLVSHSPFRGGSLLGQSSRSVLRPCRLDRNTDHWLVLDDFCNLTIWDIIDFSFAIMVASLPVFYRPLDGAFKYMRKVLVSRTWRTRSSTGQSYTSSIRKRIGTINYIASAMFDEPRNDTNKEGGKDVLLSSASHMGCNHERKLADEQRTSVWQSPRSEDIELAQMSAEERV